MSHAPLYHISDPHLSFDAEGKVTKPMHLKKWALGSPNYQGYLEKIVTEGNQIPQNAIVLVTGDCTHEMHQTKAAPSFEWFRNNVEGILIFIRGNHDHKIKFSQLRDEFQGYEQMHFLDEGEIITVREFRFGVFSVHDETYFQTPEFEKEILMFAEVLVLQAKRDEKIPVILSHYPVTREIGEKLGAIGVKLYCSGHIHCTEPGGSNFAWYDNLAKPTDRQILNGCYFSTGTTDVNLQLVGTIFRKLPELGAGKTLSPREQASKLFQCSAAQLEKFKAQDPWNPHVLEGFICHAKGAFQGSLFITTIDEQELPEPQVVYGVPKLSYPYRNQNSTDGFQNFEATYPKLHEYIAYFAEKWNGVNITFYRYEVSGKHFLTAKTKMRPVISNSEYGDFQRLTEEALETTHLHVLSREGIEEEFNNDPQLCSLTYELCGKKKPHLVNYHFDLELKFLFKSYRDGSIAPAMPPLSVRFSHLTQEVLGELIRNTQTKDFADNEAYRKERGLQVRYEHDHFITEGRALYILGPDGKLIGRTIYKIKPRDIEEVHWQDFARDIRPRTLEAYRKLREDGSPLTEETLRQEMDMGPKEWNKWGKAVLGFAKQARRDQEKGTMEVIVLCGFPGSGKSTWAKNWVAEKPEVRVRINQDDLGSRKACKVQMEKALQEGKSIVVDRCNFDINQRKTWVDLALEHGIHNIQALVFDTSVEECIRRAETREGHPTLTGAACRPVIEKLVPQWVGPTEAEGFQKIQTCREVQDQALTELVQLGQEVQNVIDASESSQ
jgi:predicted phosphohydrolase/predicted kinase